MKTPELFQEIGKGSLLPLYYFWGPEKWLIDDAVKKIETLALSPASRDFNRAVFDAEEAEVDSILSSLQAFPVRSPWRLVIIRKADEIWKKAPSPFIEYFQNPNPRTCAVFIGVRADLRAKFFQSLEKKGAVVPFYPPFERDLVRWVHLQAEQMGHPISDEAVALLVERVGPNLREILGELQKLSLGKDRGRRIHEEDVSALTTDFRWESPFEFSLAVGRLKRGEALRLLHRNLQQGEPPILLFSLLVRQLRLIQRAKEMRSRGMTNKEVEGKLRIAPRHAEDFWTQVNTFASPFPEGLWPATWKTDRRMKLSRGDKGLLLEEYVLRLLGNRTENRPSPRTSFRRVRGGG
jgi:DNA polymerase-3 subunit delta